MDPNTYPDAPQVPAAVDEADLLAMPDSPAPGIDPSEIEGGLEPALDTAEQQGLFLDESAKQFASTARAPIPIPSRPSYRRENSVPAPAPLHLPPPAPPAPPLDPGNPTDSLSLAQLRRLVTDMPRVEPAPYAFVYEDASSFEDELEEWFSYSVEEQAMVLKAQSSFAHEWGIFHGLVFMNGSAYEEGSLDWASTNPEQREEFVRKLLAGVKQTDPNVRLKSLEALVYLLLGCWHETAGLTSTQRSPAPETEQDVTSITGSASGPYARSAVQLQWIKYNFQLILECEGLQTIFDAMQASCLRACGVDVPDLEPLREGKEAERREVWCTMTSVYVFLEVARVQEKENQELRIRDALLNLKPNLLLSLIDFISRLRWDENISLSLHKISLLTWKTILVYFGGLPEVEKAKSSFRDQNLGEADPRGQPLITASPLDYHLFRQEISSKYPAYNPPPPFFPLEPENNSILPPLKNHPSKASGSHVFGSRLANLNGNVTSIFHQPVHIATPAPSPPPSPAGPGGKGGKKQNYQTNQMFPFLYPPLDETSNKLGGKGTTDLQDLLVGRKWEGSDIPASILEAAELFAKRMRATRAMKQLWEERVQFMKYERGWAGPDENGDVDLLALSTESNATAKGAASEKKEVSPAGSIEERMQLVESFYKDAFPNLQSMVIVLIKVILSHVTTLVTQASGVNGLQSGFQFQENQNGITSAKPDSNGAGGGQNDHLSTIEELDAMRTQEILDKAVSGILILLLKWFKVSHILKYEYLTQLLVDSSYIPLILKLLQLQEIEKVVNYKCEREDLNFFHFCRAHSRLGFEEAEKSNPQPESDSDDAAPPPIKLRRDETARHDREPDTPATSKLMQPPEVDELGFPTNELPTEPITNYSWRAFFSSINYLRIMQKVCKNKAHRNLMLVSYKSSQFLRKCLKVPQPELRLYTLKLFKNQVPYCGRKWRQSNMRVITAVYLHCRPELRDDWLAGSDVDAEVDESVPLEQALRALTHWHNLKRYPEGMGARSGVLEEEQDFFRRELEKMDWGDEGMDDAQLEQQVWDMQADGW
ncbi:N1221-domain-containing protein [Lepidopterella palustris CBS 459.81]|uniref:N1221-domain-containing protein n=1 Tax=Lepidopterella palustris CBS 459.81 TaxID=1314670 RepID=A0A8E2EA10_9PEZI|nr:N1221-domain-containing protein [Lepidopterella palustris CBS 459.81]